MSNPIVITVPTKFIPINLAPAVVVKTEVRSISSIDGGSSDAEESTSSMDEFLVRGKKRRLDHLTWEEKLQRKKLKNRVAAQTSRDRKKARMEEMDQTIQEQSDQISELQDKCDMLQSEKEAIYGKYLDLESRFEELKARLDEQQLQQTSQIKLEPNATTSCSVGSVSTLLGSAASAPLPLQQGPYSMEAQTTLRQDRKSRTNNDEKDMLEDFDVSKLEELAESLLANVTSELEGTDRRSSPADAQNAGTGGRVPGPMVGTPPEQLEPSQETDQGSSLILTTHNYSKSPFHIEKPQESQQSDLNRHETLFGTYDNESNCITIVLSAYDVPLEEEIICDESEEELPVEEEFQVKLEPLQELLSPIPSICSDFSSSDPQPMQEEVEPQQMFKSPLTPRSFVSDGGYESLGSPTGSSDFSMGSLEEFWNLDLFPILN